MSEARFCLQCGRALVAGEIEGIPRLVCPAEACGWVHWDNPVPVVAALVQCEDREGRVLLARNHAWAPGKFGLIAGFLEREEAPECGAVREVREETALQARVERLIGAYPFPRANQVLLIYHLVASGAIVLNHELAEYRLIRPEKLQAWDYGTGLGVADWLRLMGLGG